MNIKGYEFSFAWIFAIVIGAAVIFFAIFSATKIVDTQRFRAETERGKEIGVLLNPVETILEQAKVTTITVPDETRIFNECENIGTFGAQRISTSISSGIGSEWLPEPGVASTFHNKYLFSSSPYTEGEEEFYLLSKPFNLPFKIADLIMLWSDKESYCFVGAFSEIAEDIQKLNPKALISVLDISSCPLQSKKVCFPGVSDASCNIEISTTLLSFKVYHKDEGKTVFAIESADIDDKYSLLYASIFSAPDLYDCQVGRLMGRASQLAKLFKDKSQFLEPRGCGGAGPIQADLFAYSITTSRISREESGNSLHLANSELADIIYGPGGLKKKNEDLVCELF